MFNFDMTPTYQMEYQFGFITATDLADYVQMGILTKEGYKKILGVEYGQANTTTPKE